MILTIVGEISNEVAKINIKLAIKFKLSIKLKISNKLVRATRLSGSRVREQLREDVEKVVLYIVEISVT